MTYLYHVIDAEEFILTESLPNLGTWALPNFFFKISVFGRPKFSEFKAFQLMPLFTFFAVILLNDFESSYK